MLEVRFTLGSELKVKIRIFPGIEIRLIFSSEWSWKDVIYIHVFEPNQGWSRPDIIWTKNRRLWLGSDLIRTGPKTNVLGRANQGRSGLHQKKTSGQDKKKTSVSVRAYWGIAYGVAWNWILGMSIYVGGLTFCKTAKKEDKKGRPIGSGSKKDI
jgi:hypothetical protein